MNNSCDNLLNSLKQIDGSLGDIRLSSATYNSKENTLDIIVVSDIAIDSDGVDFLVNSISKQLPNGIKISIIAKKSICDKKIAKMAISKYIKDNCFEVAHLITDEDIKVLFADKRVVYEISLSDEIAGFFERTAIISRMEDYLSRNYSNDFEGKIVINQRDSVIEEYKIETVDENSLEKASTRYVKVNNVMKFLDDKVYDMAVYIADGENTLGQVYFAGMITSKEQRETKNNKPYFVLTLDDGSGKISGKFFTNDKNKLKKMEKVEVGSIVIIRGNNELFNDSPSLMIKGLNFCEFPKNYKALEKPSKKAPENYSVVFPEKTEITKQDNFFTVEFEYPEEFKNSVYTVVDFETTGTDIINDKITEIGAVKIVNGKIVEKFQTLVNPGVHISDRIVEITGIDDELVKDAPTIDKVFPDLFKFLGDSIFVAHNTDFDYRLIKNVGKNLGYIIKNDYIDTLALSRKVLPSLSRHRLNDVCGHFGIVFNHHRALSDAFATAEMFLELKKDKKSYN